MLTPRHDIDGYGDRPDIAIERDRQQGIARDKQMAALHDSPPTASYGTSTGARPVSEIALDLIQRGKGMLLASKENVSFDMSWHEAVSEACIQLGISDEDFSPYVHQDGHEVELQLYA